MPMARRFALGLAWLALLVLAGAWVGSRLKISGDLRAFLPEPETADQQLLIEGLGDGPGSRLLLLSLSQASPEVLAQQSRRLAAMLAEDGRIELVANGGEAGTGLDAIEPRLRPYRYLLSPGFDAEPLDAALLREALAERLQDLGSPAADLIEPLLPSDPTLETLALAEAWQPATGPQLLHGVWFDQAGNEALLLLRTAAAGFDPSGQADVVAAVQSAFAQVSGTSGSQLLMTGPGAFSVEIGARTSREASRLGMLATALLVVMFWYAYRSGRLLLVVVLPLASALLAGVAAVIAVHGSMHGITLAFGVTLLGVAQDYPVHLFSHLRPGEPPRTTARILWPTLLAGVLSTCLAYASFLVAGVDGLRQLAVFTITGLLVAAATTRFLLPRLLDAPRADIADLAWVQTLSRRVDGLPAPAGRMGAALGALALAAAGTALLVPGPFWQDDLSRLTPVPEASLASDGRLRAELGAADVRYLLVIEAADVESVLRASGRLAPALDTLVGQGAISGYDMAARYLPSVATQQRRQQRLPEPSGLRTALADALQDSPFRADAFADFLADVEAARMAAPLRPADLEGTLLETAVSGLLMPGRDGGAVALVTLQGLADPAAVAAAVQRPGVRLIDLKQASESLVSAWRARVLGVLALAAGLLVLTIGLALRSWRRSVRVLAPMALSLLLSVAVLRAAGVELNLFHLVSLMLAAGLGLDYALFFERAGTEPRERRRTLHAILVCAGSTGLVFGVLGLSSIPVLRAIGSTVALGVAANFLLALLIARAPAAGMVPQAAPEGR